MNINTKPSLSFEDIEVAFSNKSNWELRKSYGLFRLFNYSSIVSLGTKLTPLAIKWHLPVTPFIKLTIYEQFCGGETLRDCQTAIEHLGEKGINAILDYGVEAKSNETEYDNTCRQILKTIDYGRTNEHVSVVSVKITGLGRFELLEKIHAGEKMNATEKKEYQRIHERVHKISSAAKSAGIQIYYDAEETWIQQPLNDLIEEMMRTYNRDQAIIFNTFQLYTTGCLPYLMEAHQQAAKEGYFFGAKLVRGAYMEKERARAKQQGYPSPIHQNKKAVDADYNAAIDYCLKNLDAVSFCCASHNEYSNKYLAMRMDEKNIPRNHAHIAFGQLYGMGENLTFNLAAAGYRALKLIPYGPVKDVIPYLLRRAEENSSVGGQVTRELNLLKSEMKRRGLL
jgi:proline dehydrogenase